MPIAVSSGPEPDRTRTSIAQEEFAARLREVRDRTGQSLRELQKSTFASDSALSRYFAGRTLPPWRVVEALCAQASTDPMSLRATWEQARDNRERRRREANAEPERPAALVVVRDLHQALTSTISAIKNHADGAVSMAESRGEPVPDAVLTIQAESAEAMAQLSTTLSWLSDVDQRPAVDAEDINELVDRAWEVVLTSSSGGEGGM